MYRAIVTLTIMCAVGLYVRHQFQSVAKQITAKQPPIVRTQPQESRRKCVMCNGTGRSTVLNFNGGKGTPNTQPCPTCKGAGWVDNPLFGR